MDSSDYLDLDINFSEIKSFEDYNQIWEKLVPVKVTMTEKNEQCRHKLADSFVYRNHYDKPEGICSALHHVLQLYILRASLGFPSWEKDPGTYKIHCPDKKGTVWEIRRQGQQ
jgi:uncharacterized repeat protein (TIGR04076 family)